MATGQQVVKDRTLGGYIVCCFACRDDWVEESAEQGSALRDAKYAQFKAWLLSAFARPEPPESVMRFFQFLMQPADPTLYTTEDLKVYLDQRKNDRNYRAVVSGDVGSVDGDNRVRDLMKFLIKEKESGRGGSSLQGWICQFFTSRTTEPTTDPLKKNATHRTEMCSRFEQLLFLVGVSLVSNVLKGRKLRKKRKREEEAGNRNVVLASLKGLTGVSAQKMGYGVQTVVYGWNAIAREVGFASIEEMVMPYFRVVGAPVDFEVIRERARGFAPYSQRKSLEVNVEPTHAATETFPGVCDRFTELDEGIRRLAEEFFDDFRSVIMADGLYGDALWDHLNEFQSSGGFAPPRFERLNPAVVKTVKDGMSVAVATPSASMLPRERPLEDGSDTVDIAAFEEADESVEESAGGNVEQSEAVLARDLKKWAKLLCCSFDEVAESFEHVYPSDELTNKVQLVLTDPPFNVRRENGRRNASYDSLSVGQMEAVVDTFYEVLRPGGHVVMFCSGQQLPIWVKMFNNHGSKTMVADKTALFMAWHPQCNKSFPGRWSTSLQNCMEQAVHVKKKGLQAEQEGEMVNYRNFNFVGSDYHGTKNIINNVKGLTTGEQVRVLDEKGERTVALRNEQKPIALLKELISRFSQPGDMVMDCFGGTFSTAVACFSLLQHRKFIGCEADKHCFEHAQKNVIRRFARVVVEGETDMVLGGDEIEEAARNLLRSEKRKKIGDPRWEAPAGLPQYQALPESLVSYVANRAANRSLYIQNKHRGVHEWPNVMQGSLQTVGVGVLRSLDAVSCGVVIEESLIKYKGAGLGVFAIKSFGPGDVIGPFYGTLVYHNLLKRKDEKKEYGKGLLAANVERFRRYAIQVRVEGNRFGKVRELIDGKKAISVVPAPFCAMGYVNDFRYHPEDEEFAERDSERARKGNAEFSTSRNRPVRHPDDLRTPFLNVVRATRYINPGEEIYVNYGNTYEVFLKNCK